MNEVAFVAASVLWSLVIGKLRKLFARSKKVELLNYATMDQDYLVALNELNILAPTDDPEEKRLAAYLEAKNTPRSQRVSGNWSTLYSPGLHALFDRSAGSDNNIGLSSLDAQMQRTPAQELSQRLGLQGLGQQAASQMGQLQQQQLGNNQQQNQLGGLVGPNQLMELLGMRNKH